MIKCILIVKIIQIIKFSFNYSNFDYTARVYRHTCSKLSGYAPSLMEQQSNMNRQSIIVAIALVSSHEKDFPPRVPPSHESAKIKKKSSCRIRSTLITSVLVRIKISSTNRERNSLDSA